MTRNHSYRVLVLLIVTALLFAGATGSPAAPVTPAGGASALPAPEPFDSTTTILYLRTGRALAKAVARGDSVAFRALYADSAWDQADDWTRAMLANQKRKFGPVVSAHGLFRGVIRMGRQGVGLPPRGAAILLRFRDGGAASMSITVGADGRITTSSLWVAVELAAASNEGTETLWPEVEGSQPK